MIQCNDEGRPRALYLSFNAKFMDPTREHLLKVLDQATDLRVHGPGYVSDEELDLGVRHLVDNEGPFDFVITDEYVLQTFDTANLGSIRFVNHACAFDPHLLIKAIEWREFLTVYGGKRIITLMQSDYYNFPKIQIERLESLADFYVCWGAEFVMSREALAESAIPSTGVNRQIFETWNDNFRDFAIRNAGKIMSCPHFVASDEQGGAQLAGRPYPWAVLGADYNSRVEVRKSLDSAKLGRSGKWLPIAFSLGSRLNFNVYNKYWTIRFFHNEFRRALRNAKYAFTCGSILRWPIRKYFEVPINGAVLVCEPPAGYGALGFEDRYNSVICEAKDILDADDWLQADPGRAQEIADRGRRLVLERHSVEARARQLKQSLNRIKRGKFSGSRWHKGSFELND